MIMNERNLDEDIKRTLCFVFVFVKTKVIIGIIHK